MTAEWAKDQEVMGVGGDFGDGYEAGYKKFIKDLVAFLEQEK